MGRSIRSGTAGASYVPDGISELSASVSGGVGPTITLTNRANASGDQGSQVFRSGDIDRARIIGGTTGVAFGGCLTFQTIANYYTPGWQDVLYIGEDKKVGVNTVLPTAVVDVNSDVIRLRTAKTPASAGAAGNAGDICWDSSFLYVCIATNTWRRIAHGSW